MEWLPMYSVYLLYMIHWSHEVNTDFAEHNGCVSILYTVCTRFSWADEVVTDVVQNREAGHIPLQAEGGGSNAMWPSVASAVS